MSYIITSFTTSLHTFQAGRVDSATRPAVGLPGLLLVCLVAFGGAVARAAQPPDWLIGDWVLDSERTQELQPKQKSGGGGSGLSMPTVSVGGVYVPLPGTSSSPVGGGNARDPRVLRCETMSVEMLGDDVHFVYQGVGEEVMKPGNDQGRKTSWSRNKLAQTYETTTRKVSKSWELQKDGSVLVKVRINPKGSKAATHVRLFRPAPVNSG